MEKLAHQDFKQARRRRAQGSTFAVFICLIMQTIPDRNAVAQQPVEISRDVTKLPQPVQRMRQAILIAAASGDIEQLRVPIDMNEIRPIFAKGASADPVAYLRSQSEDGNGRQILAILFNLLTNGYAVTNPGTKNEMIVWPYHAAIALSALTPPQEVDIYRFLSPSKFKDMAALQRYTFYSIGISRDGVWHYFTKD